MARKRDDDKKVVILVKLEDLLKDLDEYELSLFMRKMKDEYKIYTTYDAFWNRYIVKKEENQ